VTVPFSFAFVDPTETIFGSQHLREDEKIKSVKFEQSEGDFGSLLIEVRNRRDGGLLQAGRKRWVWLGYKGAPIFFGQIVGVPSGLSGNTLTLLFIARPENVAALKAALADTLRVDGWFDKLFVDPAHADDVDFVLEGYGALWSYDPVTHVVGYSDYLVGEDGIEEFVTADVPDGTLDQTFAKTARSVTVEITFNWTQKAIGLIDLGKQSIDSYTWLALINSWPQPGADFGGGYIVDSSSAVTLQNLEHVQTAEATWQFQNHHAEHRTGDTLSVEGSSSIPNFNGAKVLDCTLTVEAIPGFIDPGFTDPDDTDNSKPTINIASHYADTRFYVPMGTVNTTLVVRYEPERDRQETVRFTMSSNIQPIITLAGEDEPTTISLSTIDVGLVLDGDTDSAILDQRRRSYVTTDRGILSLEYALHRGDAWLKLKSRAVETSWGCSFERAIALRTRKNARLTDPRMPGGVILGKIIKYSWFADGKKRGGSVTIGSSIGYGNAIAAVAGTPVYVNAGYFNPGEVQKYVGRVRALPGGNVGYSVPTDRPVDDGLDFLRGLRKSDVVTFEQVTGSVAAQEAAILAGFATDTQIANANTNTSLGSGIPIDPKPSDAAIFQKTVLDANKKTTADLLKENPRTYEIHLKNLNSGPFGTEFGLTTVPVEYPKQVDLEVAKYYGRLRATEASDVAAMAGTVV
jgi:hypothetical protein